jgi:hypothetical protein
MRLLNTKGARLAGLFTAACVLLPSLALAQSDGHYPAGVEGIKAGSIPPPGFYTKDYNYLYWADRVNDGKGDKVPMEFNATVYVNVLRNIWVTKWKILGADYGMDFLVPFVYTDLHAGAMKDSAFEVGDMYFEPLLLAWHAKQFDVGAGYSFWAPTGEYDKNHPSKPGKGFWSNMLTLGGTWYPTEDKSWAASCLSRYEFHTARSDHLTRGDNYTLEAGLSKGFQKTVDVGVIGYYQQQVTKDSGRGATAANLGPGYNRNVLDRVFGVGPEVNVFCGKCKLFISARYAYELGAQGRGEGQMACVTLTKIW